MHGASSNRNNESLVSRYKPLWQLKLTNYVIIFCISLLGSTKVVAVKTILRKSNNIFHNRTKAACSYFLVNMTIADLVVTVSSIPFELMTAEAGPKWLVSGIFGLILSIFLVSGRKYFNRQLISHCRWSFLSDVSPSQEGHHSARCKAYLTLIWLTTITFTSPLFEVYQIKTENITKICYSDFNSLPSIQVYFIFICSFRSHALSRNGHWHETLV